MGGGVGGGLEGGAVVAEGVRVRDTKRRRGAWRGAGDAGRSGMPSRMSNRNERPTIVASDHVGGVARDPVEERQAGEQVDPDRRGVPAAEGFGGHHHLGHGVRTEAAVRHGDVDADVPVGAGAGCRKPKAADVRAEVAVRCEHIERTPWGQPVLRKVTVGVRRKCAVESECLVKEGLSTSEDYNVVNLCIWLGAPMSSRT